MQPIYAKGGRKRSTSRAYLSLSQGEDTITINKLPLEQYFSNSINVIKVKRPLALLKDKEGIDPNVGYNISVFVRGGGTTGQAEAARHAIAQAISHLGEPQKAAMKAEKLLTRDGRRVESKKSGLRKARKTTQWTKR